MNAYKHILCVIDLSAENRQIISRAEELARLYSSRLSLLHVVEHLPSEVTNNIVLPNQQGIEDYLVEAAKETLDKLKSAIDVPSVDANVVLGSTKFGIIDAAKEKNIDLIVIGRHGRHGIFRLLGSTANAVLHHAPCDVLAVRIPD